MADNVVRLPVGKPKGMPELPDIPVMSFTGKDGSVQDVELTHSEYVWYLLVFSKLAEYRNAIRWFVVSNPEALKLNVRRSMEMRIPRAHFEAFTASFDFTYVSSLASAMTEADFNRIFTMEHCTIIDEVQLEKTLLPYAIYLLPTADTSEFELVFAEL
ncbi:hypothetical protein pEaSNUABM11_00263 [Erwinia phage pEa_SNUABM_11]|nr:hypothetical protein pEaSNUABM11_00263 [Erwinia phage pEa_SNUABM_11]